MIIKTNLARDLAGKKARSVEAGLGCSSSVDHIKTRTPLIINVISNQEEDCVTLLDTTSNQQMEERGRNVATSSLLYVAKQRGRVHLASKL